MSHSILSQDEINTKCLSILLEISSLLEQNAQSADTLNPSLMILADQFSLEDATITIFDNQSKEIYIDASYGLSSSQQTKGRYQLGEGIIGEVVQTKQRKIVPKIDLEPKFLHRAKNRKQNNVDFSFICVPIKENNEVTGTLSITVQYNDENELKSFADFLTIFAFFLVQPIILRRKLSLIQKKIKDYDKNLDTYYQTDIDSFIGNARSIKELKKLAVVFSQNDNPLFISGELGTGKTFLANLIHNVSRKSNASIVQFNCSLYSSDKKENFSLEQIKRLFGSYAYQLGYIDETNNLLSLQQSPLIVKANQSTLLIEDIEYLSKEAQEILLRVMQISEITVEKQIVRLSIRFMFSSQYSLSYLYEEGKIIKELYELLSNACLDIPALRERKEDIILLSDMFLQHIATQMANTEIDNAMIPKRFSTPAIDLLNQYHWPGNINELYQAIESSAYMSKGGVVHAHMFPPSLQSAQSTNTYGHIGLHEAVERLEKDLIIDALKFTNGHLSKTAKELNISERILGLRIKKYGIKPKLYR